MQITVRLGASTYPHSDVLLNLAEDDPISEILAELKQQLSPWYVATMERGIEGLDGPDGVDSVVGGIDSLPIKASLFLAVQSDDGYKKLDPVKRLSDYQIDKNPMLFLMCSAASLNNQ